jgi:hypothetical protein
LIYVYLPNVWFYGGTAFSDIPASAVVLAALTLLLRGGRDRRAYFAGALLLGVAVGFRPQTLVIGCAASLLASYVRLTDVSAKTLRARLRDFGGAMALGGMAAIVPYAAAAMLSGDPPYGYFETCATLRDYVRHVDSFLSPRRAPLPTLVTDFFVRPMRAGRISLVLSGLAALALLVALARAVRARGRDEWAASVFLVLLTFLPFVVFAWLMLDPRSVSRYSTGYVTLHALLAACGAEALARPLRRARRWLAPAAQALVILLIAGDYARWTWPALLEVKDVSPTVRATDFVRSQRKPDDPLYSDVSMLAVAGHEVGEDHLVVVDRERLPLVPAVRGIWMVEEGVNLSLRTHDFRREPRRLAELVRDRYFIINAYPAGDALQLLEGWYGREWDGVTVWCWSSAPRAVIRLLPSAGERATLTLAFSVARQMIGKQTIEVRVNGVTVDRLLMTDEQVRKTYDVAARTKTYNEVELLTNQLYTPSEYGEGDARHLGVRLDGVAFEPSR